LALNSRFFVLGIVVLIMIFACSTQKKITVQYIGQRYSSTQNKSFVNNELLLLKGNDTIHMNVKLPYNSAESDTVNSGILYRCFLKTNKLYTIKLKPICPADIPDVINSYYKINAIPKKNCSTFTEVKMDTEFQRRNPGKYVDIDHKLYELTGIVPDTDCAYE
jgi:hypothetical protein